MIIYNIWYNVYIYIIIYLYYIYIYLCMYICMIIHICICTYYVCIYIYYNNISLYYIYTSMTIYNVYYTCTVCVYIYIHIQVWFVWLCPPITVGTIRCVTSRSKWGGRCSILNSRWMICPADYKASSHTRRLFGRWPVISKNVLKCDTL